MGVTAIAVRYVHTAIIPPVAALAVRDIFRSVDMTDSTDISDNTKFFNSVSFSIIISFAFGNFSVR